MQELRDSIKQAVKALYSEDIEPEISRPEEQFGDFSTNAAMQLAAKAGGNPREIAEKLAEELKKQGFQVSVAGPGFLNIKLHDKALTEQADKATELPEPLKNQEILVEFGDPNPFKEMHIGHLYQYIVGDVIANLLAASGATVKRLSYHGDVGLHVAKAIFGLQQMEGLSDDTETIDRENYLGKAYALGAKEYNDNPGSHDEIDRINQSIYDGDDDEINKLHQEGVELSFTYFDKVLALLNVGNDKRYLESQTIAVGTKLVKDNIGKVFKESQGAIVFEGEKVGLHTRVFITSKGLPTYETKDLGLTQLKKGDYPEATRSIVVTGNEQSEYFKVMLAALAEIDLELAKKTTHISSGFVSLSSGKMSSRTGNVYAAMELLLEVKDAVHKQYPESEVRKEVTFGAVKYAFLKHRLGSDIVIDINESIGLGGNSGPYLQYAHARARSILAKAGKNGQLGTDEFQEGERSLARKISEYPEVIAKATQELMPHHICSYLYELAQTFNSFYEGNRVIGGDRESLRLGLVGKYTDVLKHGLSILNIEAPEKM